MNKRVRNTLHSCSIISMRNADKSKVFVVF